MRVYLRTFGCRANQYDTEAVRAMVLDAGHAVVDVVDDADVAVFNSCAVTSEAEAELRKAVRRAASDRPGLRSVVMGCASALDDQRPAALKARTLPSVSHVVAGADMTAIAGALELSSPSLAQLTRRQSGTRALLRIQDGCDEHCTFCATTVARGANESRPVAALVEEARLLAEHHAEIVITGIHIGTYGRDAPRAAGGREASLGALMERLVRDVPSVRYRLTSIEATEVDETLIELMASEPRRLAPHIHAPLQSASDRLLKRMGRHWYTRASYAAAVERIAARVPVLGLGADVITGFPGERDADHQETLALVRELPFTYLHVFPYSVRPGTAAERLPDRVDGVTSTMRAAELRATGRAKAAAHAARRDGTEADVIVIGEGGKRHGLTEDYLEVEAGDHARPRGARFTARLRVGATGLRA